MPAISISKTSRNGLLAAATALLASCGGGGGNPIQAADQFLETADTLIITDEYWVLGDGRTDYDVTRCSHNQCTLGVDLDRETPVTVTVQDIELIDPEERTSLSGGRLVRRINGVEIKESLREDAEGNYVSYGAALDNVWFWSNIDNWTDGVRRGRGVVAGQASGRPPETTARYNGAWAGTLREHRYYGAAVLVYRFTSTGGEIDAFFYDADQDTLRADILGVAVNALGKFKHGQPPQDDRLIDGTIRIDGSFFGGAADEVGGIVEWQTQAQGGGALLGAFGAEKQS